MPTGRYSVMDGEGNTVGTEDFRCAPGPAGWRYVSEISTSEPEPHRETVDLVVDAAWHPVRLRITTGHHELVLGRAGDAFSGVQDREALDVPWRADLDYLSPAFNAATANRIEASADIEVVYLEPVTCQPRFERQRYELIGDEKVETPVGFFEARRWRYTALATGWTRELWVAGDVVVHYEDLYELIWYEAGASGPRPLT
ncbi:MAG TPA: putative glycolipid-binding domain-containing protein [Actinomycetota bacterium]|nr:putative glycolipid-binding domain-containing protein [Actinomycetota bacterium]